MTTNIKIVYFAYLVPNAWLPVVKEQLDSLKQLDLYHEAINIYISVISDDVELDALKMLIHNEYPKIEIMNHHYENVFEYPGIKTVYDVSNENEDNTIILYFHSKGMTSNCHLHRKNLFNYTIFPYKQIIIEFNNNDKLDVAAILPHPNGFAYFNFFWVRSSYVRKWLPEPRITTDRFYWEYWIGPPDSKKGEVITYSPILGYNKITAQDPVFWQIIDRE